MINLITPIASTISYLTPTNSCYFTPINDWLTSNHFRVITKLLQITFIVTTVIHSYYSIWLVVLNILKNISQWEGLSHILWKIKHVWNHHLCLSLLDKDGGFKHVLFSINHQPGINMPHRMVDDGWPMTPSSKALSPAASSALSVPKTSVATAARRKFCTKTAKPAPTKTALYPSSPGAPRLEKVQNPWENAGILEVNGEIIGFYVFLVLHGRIHGIL